MCVRIFVALFKLGHFHCSRALWDAINSAAMERQSALEESLLSLGEFEEAYSELWAWLTDALRQLGEAEPITGDPDLVAAQLARHKVYIHIQLQKKETSIYLYACIMSY